MTYTSGTVKLFGRKGLVEGDSRSGEAAGMNLRGRSE